MNQKLIDKFVIGSFVVLYVLTSCISTIHVIGFFRLSNPNWLATTLAIAFEVGAAASLASIIALKKMNKGIVWALFFMLTLMQAMGNTYYAYTHLVNYQSWIELFGLVDSEVIEQKRILSLVSGAILPLVALGFIKSLVDYIKPDEEQPKTPDTIPAPTFPADLILVNKGDEEVDITDLKEAKVDYDAIIKAGQEAQHAKIMEVVNRKAKEREERGETYEDEPTALANSFHTERITEDELEAEVESEPEDEVIPESQEPIVEENKEEDPKMKILNNIKVFVNGEAK